MVSIVRRKVGKKEYQYLHYTYRLNGKVNSIDMRLDEKFQTIDEGKKQFIILIVEKRWQNAIDQILKNYTKSLNGMSNVTKLKLHHARGIGFTFATNKIEGSTLSLSDVYNVVDNNILPKKSMIRPDDITEAKTHMKVYKDMMEYDGDICWDIILEWHDRIFSLTKPSIAGLIREWEVEIAGSKYTPPKKKKEILNLIEKLYDWYNEEKNKMNPVLLACLFSLEFVSIHPYGDGNGRMGRLLMNFILSKNNYPIFIINPDSKYGYIKALERTQITNDNSIFVGWFYRKYITSNKQYLDKFE